jgi:hypothetical protein
VDTDGTASAARSKIVAVVVAVFVLVLGTATPAAADGGTTGADLQVAQTLGDRELTVIIRRVDAPSAPLQVDVVTHVGTPAGRLALRASTAGETVSATTVDLGAAPGFHTGMLRVDRAGPWELAVDDGEQVATIGFIVPAIVTPPWEKAVYGGFVAAGVLLFLALGTAVTGRVGLALVPTGGVVAALAVALTAGVLAPTIPTPPAPGADLDPTAGSVNDPYRRPPLTDMARPAVNLVATMEGADLRLRVSDGATGRPVDDLLVHHDALIHLVVVSPSGAMKHLHPVRLAPGDYRARLDPSEAGTHAVGAELARRGGGTQLVRSSVDVGAVGVGAVDVIAPTWAAVEPGTAGPALAIRPAGASSTVTAAFGSATLQPWLGMVGHMIVVGPVDGPGTAAAAPIWAHVHAMVPRSPTFPGGPDESVAAFGPDVRFTYTFPLPGRYLAWVQVERDYSIVTVPMVVDVPAASEVQG